jgi:hypothetical protein
VTLIGETGIIPSFSPRTDLGHKLAKETAIRKKKISEKAE